MTITTDVPMEYLTGPFNNESKGILIYDFMLNKGHYYDYATKKYYRVINHEYLEITYEEFKNDVNKTKLANEKLS